MRPGSLDGKRAIVTGATAGIGLATAKHLAALGAQVLLIGRRRSRLEDLLPTLPKVRGAHAMLALDVLDRQGWATFLGEHAEWLDADILVNNAGLALGTDPLHAGDLTDYETVLNTNVLGLLTMTQPILKRMVQRESGHIVNLGSVAGRWTYPGGAVYCASKFAVRALSEGMRHDTLGKGVRVTNIEPGLVETEFSIVRFAGDEARAKGVYAGTTPLTPDDVADAIAYAVTRPAHVNVQEMVLFPTRQSSVRDVDRD